MYKQGSPNKVSRNTDGDQLPFLIHAYTHPTSCHRNVHRMIGFLSLYKASCGIDARIVSKLSRHTWRC